MGHLWLVHDGIEIRDCLFLLPLTKFLYLELPAEDHQSHCNNDPVICPPYIELKCKDREWDMGVKARNTQNSDLPKSDGIAVYEGSI